MAYDLFISYSAKDKATADAVCNGLESAGLRCWIAPRDILPGLNWAEAVMNAIRDSRLMVLVFSSSSNGSQQVTRELERAVHRGIPIIPLRIEEVEPTGAFEYFIGAQHWLDALTSPLEQHLNQLAETVKRMLERPHSEGSTDTQFGDTTSSTSPDGVGQAAPVVRPKYYVYVSDTKVDMLLPQIPQNFRHGLGASTRDSGDPGVRVQKLQAVASYILQHADVGTVDSPKEYVCDTLDMRWGPFGNAPAAPMVFFSGRTDHTIIGLGGSTRHLLGSLVSAQFVSHSATGVLLAYLSKQMETEQGSRPQVQDLGEESALAAVELATEVARGPKQRVEFLAKKLQHGPSTRAKGCYVLLATPLYVALAE